MSTPPANPPKPGAGPTRQPQGGPPRGINQEQSAELLVELLQAQRQLSSLAQEGTELRASLARRTHQMGVLQHVAEILAATPKVVKTHSETYQAHSVIAIPNSQPPTAGTSVSR